MRAGIVSPHSCYAKVPENALMAAYELPSLPALNYDLLGSMYHCQRRLSPNMMEN